MRAAVTIACLALAACSSARPVPNEVDLNAAAMAAQADIANYAADRHRRRASPGGLSPTAPVGAPH